ncbi:Uncharacterised protein [Corynebacterium diphtheriae]|nr:Uncharacterised protein [Corynebacterium diphtheriae]
MAGRSGSLGRSSRHGLEPRPPAQCCFGVTADFVGRVSISFSIAKHEGMMSRGSRRRDLRAILAGKLPTGTIYRDIHTAKAGTVSRDMQNEVTEPDSVVDAK